MKTLPTSTEHELTAPSTLGGLCSCPNKQRRRGVPPVCLPAGFVLITMLWEYGIALLGFLSHLASGRRALWISRLKDEVLALGVITLVLVALQV